MPIPLYKMEALITLNKLVEQWEKPEDLKVAVRYTPGDPTDDYDSTMFLLLTRKKKSVAVFADSPPGGVPSNLWKTVVNTETGKVLSGLNHLLKLGVVSSRFLFFFQGVPGRKMYINL